MGEDGLGGDFLTILGGAKGKGKEDDDDFFPGGTKGKCFLDDDDDERFLDDDAIHGGVYGGVYGR